MKLDATNIVVLVLILTAVVFLVRFELHSRQNSRLQQAGPAPEVDKAADAAEAPAAVEAGGRKNRRRR